MLAIVVAAQFMFGVDAFVVNVAIPTIAVELHASPAEIEAVIAIYLIAYATLVITGGRLGDIYGTRKCISGRRARLHAHLAVVRAGANRTRTDPRAAGAGRDRGDDGAAGARHPASPVFRCLARPGLWRDLRRRLAAQRARARHRGTLVLIEGCVLQIVGLAVLALTVALVETPGALLLALVLAIFGYGQGLVMAPLSSAVLSTVKPASAGAGAGMYGTTTQSPTPPASRRSVRCILRSKRRIGAAGAVCRIRPVRAVN